jgi:hypothetical protein
LESGPKRLMLATGRDEEAPGAVVRGDWLLWATSAGRRGPDYLYLVGRKKDS